MKAKTKKEQSHVFTRKEICAYFKEIQGCNCWYTKKFCACVIAVEKVLNE